MHGVACSRKTRRTASRFENKDVTNIRSQTRLNPLYTFELGGEADWGARAYTGVCSCHFPPSSAVVSVESRGCVDMIGQWLC